MAMKALSPACHSPAAQLRPGRQPEAAHWATNEYKTVLSGLWVHVPGVAGGGFHGPSRNLWALLAASVSALSALLKDLSV